MYSEDDQISEAADRAATIIVVDSEGVKNVQKKSNGVGKCNSCGIDPVFERLREEEKGK